MKAAKRSRIRSASQALSLAIADSYAQETSEQEIDSTPDKADAAEYIAAMVAELASISGAAKLDMLTYFLNMARIEAESYYSRK